MTGDEYNRVSRLLKASYREVPFLDGQESIDLFFNILNRYDYRDIWKGVRDYVELEKFAPTINDIVRYVEQSERQRHEEERNNAAQSWTEAVSCMRCNDSGFIILKHRDGTEAITPCNCDNARAKFPSLFMDDDEWRAFVEDKRRKGQNQSYDRPGVKAQWMAEKCGDIVETRPGSPARSTGRPAFERSDG